MENIKLPDVFVWQKAGAESSLSLGQTVLAKEKQRAQNPDGIFLWGVGNSISQEVIEILLMQEPKPEVIFTHITSKFRKIDIKHLESQEKTVKIWPKAKDKKNNIFNIPKGSQVVTHSEKNRNHYALVCQSEVPLEIKLNSNKFAKEELRTLKNNIIPGDSQTVVPAFYKYDAENKWDKKYVEVLRARLVPPYIVTLDVKEAYVLNNVCLDENTGTYKEAYSKVLPPA